jgi:hypothetical protein
LVDYNVAILQVHYRKNSLLEYNGIYLAEVPWPAKAYFDARKRARERDAAHFIDYRFTRPDVTTRGPMPQFMNQPGQPFNSETTSPAAAADGEDKLPDVGNSEQPADLSPLDGVKSGESWPEATQLSQTTSAPENVAALEPLGSLPTNDASQAAGKTPAPKTSPSTGE